MTETVFGYLILITRLISIQISTILSLRFPLSFSFDWEDISNTQDKIMFDHISEHLDVRQKYSAVRRIFNSLLRGV